MEDRGSSYSYTWFYKESWAGGRFTTRAISNGIFELFLDEAFYEHLKTQTNLYAQQYLSANPDLPESSRHHK